MPVSMRSGSITSTPYGVAPALSTASHRSVACSGRRNSSKPSSPLNPVRDSHTGTPPTVTGSGMKRK